MNPKTWAVCRGLALALLGACLLLSGCGLASGRGSLDAGLKYQAGGQYRAAYIEAKKILQRDDKNGRAWLLLGQASLMLGDPKTAVSDLKNAEANGAPKADWAIPMARALLVTQEYQQALDVLAPGQSFAPQTEARASVLRGDAHAGLRQPDQARKAYQAALALDAKDAGALVGLARLAHVDNDAAGAGRYVQQALAAAPENPQALVMKGDLAFDAHDFAGAETAYQKVLDLKTPDWLPQERFYTLARLANAQAQQNQLDQALASIQALEKMSPEQPYPSYLRAVVLYRQGHLDGAVAALQQVLKVAPDNFQAQLLMGAVNYAQGSYGEAEMALSNAMGMDPKNVEARKLLALTMYREGRTKQALDTLRPAAPGTPTDTELLAVLQRAAAAVARPGADAPAAAGSGQPVDARFAQVDKALRGGDVAGAIRLLQAMPKGDAALEAQRASLLAMAYARDRRPDEAVKVAAAYAKEHPDDSSAHVLYGTALIAANRRDEARTQYAAAYKLDPKNFAALRGLGGLDVLEGHYADAVGRYEAALKTDPRNAAAMVALGQLAVQQGDKAGAVKWFKQAIGVDPKAATAYLGLVALYGEDGRFDDAVATARQLVASAPDNPAALNALGVAELNAGRHDDALQALGKAVAAAPQMALYRMNLARAQIVAKDTRAAADNLDQVIKADPDQLTAVALRAFMKLQAHDLPGAIALAQGLQQRPASRSAGFALEGDLYMAGKSWDKAAAAYQKGLQADYARPLVIKSFQALSADGAKQPERVLNEWLGKHPDDAAMRLLLAQYYMTQAQNASAADQYEQVLKAYPANVDALNNLAWIYAEQRNPKAVALGERAYKLMPASPNVADTYAWALLAADQPAAALPILVKAAKAAPKLPAIQYHLAVAQARTGDKAGARATLEALRKSDADFPDKAAAEALYRAQGGSGQ